MKLEEFIEKMPKFESMEYYFVPKAGDEYEVYKDGEFIGLYNDEYNDSRFDEMHKCFELFKKRPESYAVGRIHGLPHDVEANQFVYEVTLLGLALSRRYKASLLSNPDTYISSFMLCIEWLRNCKFFECPASSVYHESFPGGLVEHSLKCLEMTKVLASTEVWRDKVDLNSALLCALVHDWCKIGTYESYMRNVQDDNGEWHKVPSYKRSGNYVIPLGHGVSSYFLVSRFFRLSPEECAAIRWHMGRWNVSDEELNELQKANEQYPLVHLIQFADQLSITDYMFNGSHVC